MVKCRKKGFTLIELLVVIAIIALLLSVVMPALKEAKKRAQTIICRSNIKQWGLIFSLYAQDNDQSLPQSVASPPPHYLSDKDAYWPGATLPYYGDGKIRICPSTKPDKDLTHIAEFNWGSTFVQWGPLGPTQTDDDWWDEFPEGSYGINDWCANPPPGWDSYWGLPAANAWRTITTRGGSRIPIFMDSAFADGAPLHTNQPPSVPDNHNQWNTHAMKLYCIDRHKGGINGVFLDLSARKIGLKELWKLKWHKNYNVDNTWTRPDANWPNWMKKFTD